MFDPVRRAIYVLAIVAAAVALRAQAIELTGRISALDGQWQRDRARGIETCGSTVDQSIRIHVSASDVRFESSQLFGVVRLDGSTTRLSDGRTVSASLDGGWLVVTARRQASGQVNVKRHVYILGRDELTIWTSLNVEYPDGTLGHIGCGNHSAIIYTRQK